jgi:hypothetical protein
MDLEEITAGYLDDAAPELWMLIKFCIHRPNQ